MAPARWRKVWSIFNQALELSDAERSRYVAEACGEDRELWHEIVQLLAAHDEPSGILDSGPAGLAANGVGDPLIDRDIGPYRVAARLGEGGMGTVYKARQLTPVRRDVALKIIKLGMDTHEVVKRFEAERQALALMSHSNIAKVFDAGATEDGRPYFVMEYVSGMPITKYCDVHRLGLRDRLALLISVCEGAQHAHQKGIIHRDIKPSNILVATEGESRVPKIIDFGIAKAIEQRLTEETVYTRQGVLIGTPAYMSPEQADLGTSQVDTRTDVYSLSVLLYELLAGVVPFDAATLLGGGYAETLRILSNEDPPAASARLWQLAPAHREEIALNRSTTVRGLVRELRAELDWVALKGMEKDPGRRYATASELAGEVRRYLDGQPVTVRHSSTVYRARKFIDRHRFGVATAATIAMLIVGFAITMAVQSHRLRQALVETEQQRVRANEVSTFLVELFQAPDPNVSSGENLTVREALDRGAARLDSELAGQPQTRATMIATIGEVYRSLGLYDRADEMLMHALKIRQDLPAPRAELAANLNAVGELRHDQGAYGEAERYYREALALRRVSPDDPAPIAYTLTNLAVLVRDTGDLETSEALLREALEFHDKAADHESWHPGHTLLELSRIQYMKGDLETAESMAREGLATLRRTLDENNPTLAVALSHQSSIARARGDLGEAEQLLREAVGIYERSYGDEHSYLASTLINLGGVLVLRGNYSEAEDAIRRSLSINEKLFGREHPHVAAARYTLGKILLSQGRYSAAIQELNEALTLDRLLLGEQHPDIAYDLHQLGITLGHLGQSQRAEALHREGYELRVEQLGETHRLTALSQSLLGASVASTGDYEESGALIEQALATQIEQLGAAHPEVAASLHRLGQAHHTRTDYAAAEETYREALAMRIELLGEAHPDTALTLYGLGAMSLDAGNARGAVEFLERALIAQRNALPAQHPAIGQTLVGLANALCASGQSDAANRLRNEAAAMRGAESGRGTVLTAETAIPVCTPGSR